MAVTYAINGSNASLAPFSVNWTPIKLGFDHEGKVIYADNWQVTMQFPAGSPASAQQWLTQASGGASVNLTVLDRWQLNSIILSAVSLELTSPPAIENINVNGFTILVHGATPSALELEH